MHLIKHVSNFIDVTSTNIKKRIVDSSLIIVQLCALTDVADRLQNVEYISAKNQTGVKIILL